MQQGEGSTRLGHHFSVGYMSNTCIHAGGCISRLMNEIELVQHAPTRPPPLTLHGAVQPMANDAVQQLLYPAPTIQHVCNWTCNAAATFTRPPRSLLTPPGPPFLSICPASLCVVLVHSGWVGVWEGVVGEVAQAEVCGQLIVFLTRLYWRCGGVFGCIQQASSSRRHPMSKVREGLAWVHAIS
jgi:hypothetical protein